MAAQDDAVCPTCGTVYPVARTHCANDGTRLVQRRAQAASATGRVLDNRFEVRELIGEGFVGAVYRGMQLAIDREVAIKILRPAFASDPAIAERMFQAAQLAAQLGAPAIATTYDFGRTDDGLIFLVMELVRGRNLADEAQGRAMAFRRVVPIAIQICEALDAAEKQQTFHGDLKPTNIMVLDEAGRREIVKVGDFGLARAVSPDVSTIEAGRLLYMAPEVASTGVVTARSDLYALGCVLYHLLTGKPPHEDSSTRGLLEKHAREAPLRLSREIPPKITSIISRLLAKAPDQRFDSAAAVRAALYAVLGRTPGIGVALTDSDEPGSRPPRSPTGSHTQPAHTGTFRNTGVSAMYPNTGVSAMYPDTGQGIPRDASRGYAAVDVSQAYPAVDVSQAYPSQPYPTDVSQAYPAVDVSQAYPAVDVSQAYPAVGVSQAYPATGVSQAYQAAGVSQAYPAPGVGAMHPPTGPRVLQPPMAPPAVQPVTSVAPSSSLRFVVIAIVVIVVVGLGLVAYTLVG